MEFLEYASSKCREPKVWVFIVEDMKGIGEQQNAIGFCCIEIPLYCCPWWNNVIDLKRQEIKVTNVLGMYFVQTTSFVKHTNNPISKMDKFF